MHIYYFLHLMYSLHRVFELTIDRSQQLVKAIQKRLEFAISLIAYTSAFICSFDLFLFRICYFNYL